MNTENLRFFMSVMEYRNFSKAASATFTTQSNISKQISALERELGTRLFTRSNAGVSPTPAGQFLYSGLESLLPALESLMVQTSRISAEERLSLRIGIVNSMSINPVLPVIRHFRDSHPQVDITMESLGRETLLQQLSLGNLDVAFVFSVWPAALDAARRIPVTRSKPVIYYSRNLEKYRKDNLTIQDFMDATFARTVPKGADSYNAFCALPFQPREVIYADSIRSVQLYVASGLACAVLGKSQSLYDNANIATFEFSTSAAPVGTDAVWLTTSQNPAVALFVDSISHPNP